MKTVTRLSGALVLSLRCASLCAAVLVAAPPALAQLQRTYSSAHFALSLDGPSSGLLHRVSGGTIKAEVVTELESVGKESIVRKRIATIVHEPFTMELGMGMGKEVYQWIRESFDHGFVRKNGAIVAADFDFAAQSRREFFDALITEVTFPALDAASKEPAYLTVKIAPEEIAYKGGNGIQPDLAAPRGDPAKMWMPSNFALEIGDLPTRRVTKIDSFTWKQSAVEGELGPTGIELPNLKVTISMADLKPWQDWFQSFVIEGHDGDGDELSGGIAFLGTDSVEELGRIEFFNVGIVSLEIDAAEANADVVPVFTVELYMEAMTFSFMEGDDDEDEGEGEKDESGR